MSIEIVAPPVEVRFSAERIGIYPVAGRRWIDFALNWPLVAYADCAAIGGLQMSSLTDWRSAVEFLHHAVRFELGNSRVTLPRFG